MGGKEEYLSYFYRAEGNKSLVISNNKTFVYRLFKKCQDDEKRETQLQQQRRVIDYVKHVMKPVIGDNLSFEGELISISTPELSRIQSLLKMPNIRPDYRCHKYIDDSCNIATRMPDYCYIQNNKSKLPTFAVEIKPKCGYRVKTANQQLPPENSLPCKFCCLQYVKLKQNRCKTRSAYCPLDLFSGDPSRVQHALRALYQNPQNNLRIFVDGALYCSEDCVSPKLEELLDSYFQSNSSLNNSVDNFCDLISNCLLREDTTTSKMCSTIHQNGNATENSTVLSNCICQSTTYVPSNVIRAQCPASMSTVSDYLINPSLPETCILNKILKVQYLSAVDRDIYPAYTQIQEKFHKDSRLREQTLMDGPYEKFLQPCTIFPDQETNSHIDQLKRYLVGKTAIDCQIMLAIQPLERDENPAPGATIIEHGNPAQRYQFNIAVIDLDPKPMDRIDSRMKQDTAAIEAYLEASQALEK